MSEFIAIPYIYRGNTCDHMKLTTASVPNLANLEITVILRLLVLSRSYRALQLMPKRKHKLIFILQSSKFSLYCRVRTLPYIKAAPLLCLCMRIRQGS